MPIYEHSDQAASFRAALVYPVPDNLTVLLQGNIIQTSITIPLTLTGYTGVSRKSTPLVVNVLPAVDETSNSTYGGTAVSEGNSGLPKIKLEGFIDTPLNSNALPDFSVNGYHRHYASVIIAYLEGRVGASSTGWSRIDPTYFQDPYGRQYNSPKITDFQATFIEGVPFRTNFTAELVV